MVRCRSEVEECNERANAKATLSYKVAVRTQFLVVVYLPRKNVALALCFETYLSRIPDYKIFIRGGTLARFMMHHHVALRLLFAAVAAVVLVTTTVQATCPTNGDLRALYLTANGLNGFHDILMLDTHGRVVGTAINWTSVPKTMQLLKLRAMTFGPDGRLYVACALGRQSKIVAFKATLEADCTRSFDGVIAQFDKNHRYLKHPYSIVIPAGKTADKGEKGTKSRPAFMILTANQNSVSVTWMNGLDGTPLPAPEHTYKHAALAAIEGPKANTDTNIGDGAATNADTVDGAANPPRPREVVGSEMRDVLDRNGVFTIAGSTEESASADERNRASDYRLISVRGAAASPDGEWLLVADVDADAIRVYEISSGRYLWTIPVPSPIQVAFPPPGFLNLDGRHSQTDLVAHIVITTKTQNVYVAPVVDPLDTKSINLITTPPRPRQSRMADFADLHRLDSARSNGGGVEDDNSDKAKSHADARRSVALPPDLRPRVFCGGHFIATSGIDFDMAGGYLYVADRVQGTVHRIRFDGEYLGRFGPALSDQPEHLLLVQLASPEDFPQCYEFGATGVKFSVLCIAGYFWIGVAVIAGVVVLWSTLRRSKASYSQSDSDDELDRLLPQAKPASPVFGEPPAVTPTKRASSLVRGNSTADQGKSKLPDQARIAAVEQQPPMETATAPTSTTATTANNVSDDKHSKQESPAPRSINPTEKAPLEGTAAEHDHAEDAREGEAPLQDNKKQQQQRKQGGGKKKSKKGGATDAAPDFSVSAGTGPNSQP